ncbi:Transmembrane family 220, helix [Cyclobacterium lianum]|uniref:Transmembrane family 220, helix n=1 Tax=Cyclobacterium lianum TaxID=388280 RepID=A0A1M7IDR1_9BACT|nr:transmembrane 220 family protein [Cyclobacterium lianum]SHM38830.1 Transmembrane family 220, helix [Cyclobacterium lianum]
MSKVWKRFFGICAVLFLLFAYWQINDPDPEFWVPAYLLAAVTAGFAFFGRFNVNISVIFTFTFLIAAIFFWPENIFSWVGQEWEQKNLSMKTQGMEINREFFGLLVAAVVFALTAIIGRRKRLLENQKKSNVKRSDQ